MSLTDLFNPPKPPEPEHARLVRLMKGDPEDEEGFEKDRERILRIVAGLPAIRRHDICPHDRLMEMRRTMTYKQIATLLGVSLSMVYRACHDY